MSKSINHNGVVDQITDNTIHVRILQQSACAGCHARSMCGASESKNKIIEIADSSGKYRINQEVIIEGRTSLGLQAVFLAFVIPLLLMMAVVVIGKLFHWSEGASALAALGMMVPYYCMLYILRDKLKKHFVFTLKKT